MDIGEDIVDVFDAYGNSYKPFRNTKSGTFRRGQLSVRSGGRVNDPGEEVANAGGTGAELKGIQKPVSGFTRVLAKADRHDRAIFAAVERAAKSIGLFAFKPVRIDDLADLR